MVKEADLNSGESDIGNSRNMIQSIESSASVSCAGSNPVGVAQLFYCFSCSSVSFSFVLLSGCLVVDIDLIAIVLF